MVTSRLETSRKHSAEEVQLALYRINRHNFAHIRDLLAASLFSRIILSNKARKRVFELRKGQKANLQLVHVPRFT
jgi:hypothetical protein